MFRRVLMIGIAIGVGFATIQRGRAEAVTCKTDQTGKYCFLGGTWVKVAPIEACYEVARVPNPDQHPAELRCSVQFTVDSLCLNPQNQDVQPGQAATLGGELDAPIESADFDKKTGIATVCLPPVEDDCTADDPNSPSILCDPAKICPNRNWEALCSLPTEILAVCTTNECKDETCSSSVVRNTYVCSCTIEGSCADPNNPPVPGTYNCEQLDPRTLQPLGVSCAP